VAGVGIIVIILAIVIAIVYLKLLNSPQSTKMPDPRGPEASGNLEREP